MSKYKAKIYKGSYLARQQAANADKAIVYLEQHFNGGSATASYALANVGTNAGNTSKKIAAAYVQKICKAFDVKAANNDFATCGVSVGGYKGRGNGNLIHTKMPAVLLEPLFASNPTFSAQIKSESGQVKLAQALVETIQEFFPNGGLIAFSIGHKYQPYPKANDRGVPLAGGGMEADYAEKVLEKAAEILSEL